MSCVQPLGGRLDRASGRRTRHLLRRRADRGATLVEYALGVSLVCVASLGAIQFLEDGASDEFNDRADRSGAPDLSEGADGGGSTGGDTAGGTDGTDSEPVVQQVFFEGFDKPTSKGKPGEDWTAGIQVVVVDAEGKSVDGARVTGEWSYVSGGVTVVVQATCNQTSPSGACKFQLSDIPFSAQEVTFTMLDIDGGVPPVEYDGGPQVSEPIPNPHPAVL